MKSIKELYRIGTGPSSSHTMGPRRAAKDFAESHKDAASFRVTLYGSLAATGRGHLTDQAILESMTPVSPTEIVWEPTIFLPFHPNGMKYEALDSKGNVTDTRTIYSVGGGQLAEEGVSDLESPDVYDMSKLSEILEWCKKDRQDLLGIRRTVRRSGDLGLSERSMARDACRCRAGSRQ